MELSVTGHCRATMKTPERAVKLDILFPELEKFARVAVRLHPRQGNTTVTASSMGGMVLWPAEDTWPMCEEHDCPYIPVLQIRRDDVSELKFRDGTDLFQILWCPNQHQDFAPKLECRWRAEAGVAKPLASPPLCNWYDSEFCPVPCILSPERVIEYPDGEFLTHAAPGVWERLIASSELEAFVSQYENKSELADVEEFYTYQWSVAPGTKVGGYPLWIQFPEIPVNNEGTAFEYLLTINGFECDGGSWPAWMPQDDQHVWRDGDVRARLRVQQPTGLEIGDMGNIHLFIDRTQFDWPIRWIYHSS